MSRVGKKHTKPEMTVRRLLHGMGYRYRLHKKDLAGKPDLVFASRKKVLFVNGCFWHGHSDETCKLSRPPKSRLNYWEPKLARNAARDRLNEDLLRSQGWDVMVVWECQLREMDVVAQSLIEFLGPNGRLRERH
ncbi:very short patch repair endonuclease [Mesorhizobium sp. M1233]